MPGKFILAANVKLEGKVTMLGAVWDGSVLRTVRAKAAVFATAEEAKSQQFYVSCKYPFLSTEIVEIEDDPERRYHLRGGINIEV